MAANEQNNSPLLYGQDLLEEWLIPVPFTQQEIRNPTIPNVDAEISPLNDKQSIVKTIDYSALRGLLSDFHAQIGTQVRVNLPDTLTALGVVFSRDHGTGFTDTDIHHEDASFQVVAAKQDSAAVDGDFVMTWREGYKDVVQGVLHIFFVDREGVSLNDILTKVGAEAWPICRPQGHQILLYNGSVAKQDRVTDSYGPYAVSPVAYTIGNLSTQTDSSYDVGRGTKTLTIPPMLHDEIEITTTEIGDPFDTVSPTYGISPSTLPATVPAIFPTGTFLFGDPEVSPYRAGMMMVRAITVTITEDHV